MLVLNSIKNLTKPFLIFLLIGLNESITNQEPDINWRELISFQKNIYIYIYIGWNIAVTNTS